MGDWEWWQAIAVMVVGFAGIIATAFTFRFAVTLNLTEWLKHRRQLQEDRLPVLCPHAVLEKDDRGRVVVQMLTMKPVGTLQAICRRCGRVFPGGMEEVNDLMKRWAKNPKLLAEREKKFIKQCKRLGLV